MPQVKHCTTQVQTNLADLSACALPAPGAAAHNQDSTRFHKLPRPNTQ